MSGIDRGEAAQMGNRRRFTRQPTGGQMTAMTALRNALREIGFGDHPVDATLVYGASFSPSGQLPPERRVIVDVYYSELVAWVTQAQVVWLTRDRRMGSKLCTIEGRTPADQMQALERAVLSIVEVIRDLDRGTGVAVKMGD